MTSEYSPNVLTDGWDKYQVLIRFSDATPDANNNYHFVLQEPIKDVVHAEWITASSGVVNSCLYIDELNNDGQTTTKITTITPSSSAYNPSASYNIGAVVSYEGNTYIMDALYKTISVASGGNSTWAMHSAPTYDPTYKYKYGVYVYYDPGDGVKVYHLTNPSAVPGVQPVPTNTAVWTQEVPPVYDGTYLFTTGSKKVFPSVITFVGDSTFYILQVGAITAPLTQPNPGAYPYNWIMQTPPNPTPSWNDRFPVNTPAVPTTSSQTTKFWRFLSDANNYLSPSLADSLANPKTFYYLNVKVLNLDGTTKTPGGSDYIQLFFWSHRCCTK